MSSYGFYKTGKTQQITVTAAPLAQPLTLPPAMSVRIHNDGPNTLFFLLSPELAPATGAALGAGTITDGTPTDIETMPPNTERVFAAPVNGNTYFNAWSPSGAGNVARVTPGSGH